MLYQQTCVGLGYGCFMNSRCSYAASLMNQRFIELAFGFGHSPVAVGYRRVIENCGGPLPPLGKGPKGAVGTFVDVVGASPPVLVETHP